jgi:hypothetical protein
LYNVFGGENGPVEGGIAVPFFVYLQERIIAGMEIALILRCTYAAFSKKTTEHVMMEIKEQSCPLYDFFMR